LGYWFETGMPTFLVDMLTERQVYLPALLKLESFSELISAFEVGDISTEALMFQSGYLTVAKEENIAGDLLFTLGFPNREVCAALNATLLGTWIGSARQGVTHRVSIFRALQKNDFERLREIFFSLYTGIPMTGIARTTSTASKAITPASSKPASPRRDWISSRKT
jgi:hypothetical protein